MNEDHIRTFLAIAHSGSMGRAAEELIITQPAVKKRIDDLEAEIGAPLFERTQQGCSLTEAGAYFFERIGPIADELKQLKIGTRSRGIRQNTLRFCVLRGAISPGFEVLVRRYTKAHPEVELSCIPMKYNDRPHAIGEGHADVGIYFNVPDVLNELHLAFWHLDNAGHDGTQCYCLVDPESSLASRESLSLHDLRGIPVRTFDARVFPGLFDSDELAADALPDLPGDDGYEVLNFCGTGGAYLCCHMIERFETLRAIPLDYAMPEEGVITRKDLSLPTRWFVDSCCSWQG